VTVFVGGVPGLYTQELDDWVVIRNIISAKAAAIEPYDCVTPFSWETYDFHKYGSDSRLTPSIRGQNELVSFP
jgi:hypothetical protein